MTDLLTETSPHIFLSYARADGSDAAAKVATWLASSDTNGEPPLVLWQDFTSMRSGDWRDQIRAAIKASSHLIMIVTAGSLASEVCAWEWLVARLEGVEISPILGSPALTPNNLPKWMRAKHVYGLDFDASDISQTQEWRRLILSLRHAGLKRRMPIVTRDSIGPYVPRLREMNALRDLLLDANGEAIGVTTAFVGSGGMGKTTLALALARDPQIQSAFYHGQLLVELGQNPDLKLTITNTIHELTGETSQALSVNKAANELAKVLADRSVLLVIDDVWDAAHLKPFLYGQYRKDQRACARLVTTRNSETLSSQPGKTRRTVDVDEMTAEQAFELLTAGLPLDQIPPLRARFVGLAARLGHCAQVIDLSRGRLQSRVLDGWQLSDALLEAENSYSAHGVDAFDNSSSTSREDSYTRCINASLDILTSWQKARFFELAIFPEDTDVPYGTVALLWAETGKVHEPNALALLDHLRRMSLLKGVGKLSGETDSRAIRLHDVIRSYLRHRDQQSSHRLVDLNSCLCRAYIQVGERIFPKHTSLAQYAYEHLPWHLSQAADHNTLDALLIEPAWLKAKLDAIGRPLALLRDYERYGRTPLHDLIAQVLRLLVGTLTRDPGQLALQLLGRFPEYRDGSAAQFLSACRSLLPARSLVLESRSLVGPFDKEIARFSDAQSFLTDISILPNGSIVVLDGYRTLWVLNSENLTVLSSHTCKPKLHHICALSGETICFASSKGSVGLLDTTNFSISNSTVSYGMTEALHATSETEISFSCRDGTLRVYDQKNGEVRIIDRSDPHSGLIDRVQAIRRIPRGGFVTIGLYGTICIWDKENRLTSSLETDHFAPRGLAALEDGRIAFHYADNSIGCWFPDGDPKVRRIERPQTEFPYEVRGEAMCDFGDGVVVSAVGSVLRLIDLDNGEELARFSGHSDAILSVAALDSNRVLSCGYDGTLRMWDKSRPGTGSYDGMHLGAVEKLLLLDDGSAASVGQDSTIRIWNMETRKQIALHVDEERDVTELTALTGARILYADGNGSNLQVWSPREGVKPCIIRCNECTSIMTLDKNRIVVASSNEPVGMFDIVTGRELARFNNSSGDLVASMCHIDEDTIAIGGVGKRIRLFRLSDGALVDEVDSGLLHQEDLVRRLCAVSSRHILICSDDEAARIWDTKTGSIVRLVGHSGALNDAVRLGRGLVATCSDDRTIRLWRWQEAEEIARFEVDAPVRCLLGLRDGRLLAGDEAGHIHWFVIQTAPPNSATPWFRSLQGKIVSSQSQVR
jgi:WD40 repeat protein